MELNVTLSPFVLLVIFSCKTGTFKDPGNVTELESEMSPLPKDAIGKVGVEVGVVVGVFVVVLVGVLVAVLVLVEVLVGVKVGVSVGVLVVVFVGVFVGVKVAQAPIETLKLLTIAVPVTGLSSEEVAIPT